MLVGVVTTAASILNIAALNPKNTQQTTVCRVAGAHEKLDCSPYRKFRCLCTGGKAVFIKHKHEPPSAIETPLYPWSLDIIVVGQCVDRLQYFIRSSVLILPAKPELAVTPEHA